VLTSLTTASLVAISIRTGPWCALPAVVLRRTGHRCHLMPCHVVGLRLASRGDCPRQAVPPWSCIRLPLDNQTSAALWWSVACCNLLPTRVAKGKPRKPRHRPPQRLQTIRLRYCAACKCTPTKRQPQKSPHVAGSVVICGGTLAYSRAHGAGSSGLPWRGCGMTNGGRSLHSSGCDREPVNCLCAS